VWLIMFLILSAVLWHALDANYTFCVIHTVGLCLYILASRSGLVALSVYRASHVCGDVCNSSCLVLELGSADPLRTEMSSIEYSWTIISLTWGLVQLCAVCPNSPSYPESFAICPSWINIQDRFPTGDHAGYNSLKEHNRFMKRRFELWHP
jgi:hypothetical protein